MTDVAEWEQHLLQMMAEFHALTSEGRWVAGPRDLLGVIGRGRDEITHSRVLAWLFDPAGAHGLGDRLLCRVLAHAGAETGPPPTVWRITTEVSRAKSRADIVVWASTATLVIENKVDSPEGDRQCERLYSDFEDEPNALFLLLSPGGRRPRSAPEDIASRWIGLSYARLREFLISALDDVSDERTTIAAVDYLRTLGREF